MTDTADYDAVAGIPVETDETLPVGVFEIRDRDGNLLATRPVPPEEGRDG